MNELIQSLLHKAQIAHNPPGTYLRYDNISPEQLHKLAELIVRECLEACSRANEIRHFVPPTQEQVVLSCMREIETTFRS